MKPLGYVIGDRVAFLRGERGWSQKHLAQLLGEVLPAPPAWDDHTTVNLIEKGKRRVLAAELFALAHVFEVDVAALVTEPGSNGTVDLGTGDRIRLRLGEDSEMAASLSLRLARLSTAVKQLLDAESQARRSAIGARKLAEELALMASSLETVTAVIEHVQEEQSP